MIKRFIFSEKQGQSIPEYALLIAAVALTAVAILSLLGVQVGDVFCRVAQGVGAESVCTDVLFYDNFSGGLGDWRSFFNRDGNWAINEDDNSALCHIGDDGDVLLANGTEGSDYSISSDANLASGNGYGLFFRTSESETGGIEGYTFQYDPGYGGGQFIMRKWVNGYELWPPFAAASPPQGFEWHNTDRQVSVDVSGDVFTAFVDGAEVLVGSDSTYATGSVGIRTWNSSQVCFDNFTVETR